MHDGVTMENSGAGMAWRMGEPWGRRLQALARGPLPIALALSLGLWWHGFDSTTGQAVSCIVNSLAALAMIWRARPDAAWWRRASPVLALCGGALLWGVFATLIASNGWPDYASGKVVAYVSGLAALIAGALCARMRWPAQAPLDAIMACAAASLLWGLLARGGLLGGLYQGWSFMRTERFTGLIGNANVTGAVAGALAVFAVSRICAPLGPGRLMANARVAYLPVLLLAIGVVMAAGSRFASLVLLALLAIIAGQAALRGKRLLVRRRVMPAALGLAVAVAILLSVDLSAVLRLRFATFLPDGATRIATWTHLLGIALDRPLTGYGLGSFPSLNAHFLTTPRFAQSDWALNSAHDLALQLLLQAGLPYAAMLMAAGIAGLRQVMQGGAWGPAMRHSRDDWTIAAILALFLLNAMTDMTLDMPAPVTLALFLAGLPWGRALDRGKVRVT